LINYFIHIIKVYKFYIFKILFYEFFFTLLGYKGNKIVIKNNKYRTDNIPTPYYFLHKISVFLKKKRIKSLIDLGCGSGRTIFFLNKKNKIKYYGVEYEYDNYLYCKSLFINNRNILIKKTDFLKMNYTKTNFDCFFLNDPLKKNKDFKNIVKKITFISNKKKKKIYFIFVNINKRKLLSIKNLFKIKAFSINSRGFYIFTNYDSYK